MATTYSQFRSCYAHKELVEFFLLTLAELQLVLTCRGETNRCGMAATPADVVASGICTPFHATHPE